MTLLIKKSLLVPVFGNPSTIGINPLGRGFASRTFGRFALSVRLLKYFDT